MRKFGPGLRGAATLKSRAMAFDSLSRRPELLEVGAQLAVVTPSGKISVPLHDFHNLFVTQVDENLW